MDCPTILDPLILGCLLDDMPRVAWMVFKCGGNLKRILAQGTSSTHRGLTYRSFRYALYLVYVFDAIIRFYRGSQIRSSRVGSHRR